jgi:hypothetical protein
VVVDQVGLDHDDPASSLEEPGDGVDVAVGDSSQGLAPQALEERHIARWRRCRDGRQATGVRRNT